MQANNKRYKLKSPYFPHDLDAMYDPKIVKLRRVHGLAGEALYFNIIAKLHKAEGYLDMEDLHTIAYEFQVESSLAESIVNDFNLFRIDQKRFTSDRVLSNLDFIAEKTMQARDAANKRWQNQRNAGA